MEVKNKDKKDYTNLIIDLKDNKKYTFERIAKHLQNIYGHEITRQGVHANYKRKKEYSK